MKKETIKEQRNKILKEKIKELRTLFLSPLSDRYPEKEMIESRLFKHRIDHDNINENDTLFLQATEYKVVNQPVWQSYSGNERDAYKRVEIVRVSDNNYYDFTINRTENYKRRLKYEYENLREVGLYYHDVTVNIPEDDREKNRKSHYDTESLENLYSLYNEKRAYSRQDFHNYIKKNNNYKSIVPVIEEAFINDFSESNLDKNIDIKLWCDNYIKTAFNIELIRK